MSVPMGYLDFAPEPPAPSATPVTEHVDLNCNPTSTDTRDISSKYLCREVLICRTSNPLFNRQTTCFVRLCAAATSRELAAAQRNSHQV